MPEKHKDHNLFRFLPFADRIANIRVDVIHRIGHRNEEQEEEEIESYFRTAVEKWSDLNCSQGWLAFKKEVKDVRSLAQLVLLKEKVASSLLQHLERKDPLTTQALLEMVVALARDIRQDFYPFYPKFLSTIITYLNSKDAEVLEWSFHCLAYLFKFLWRCMVRNIEPVLTSILPLLSSKRPKFFHYFAADSFAFLARKVKDQTAFLSLILNHLKEQPEDAEGCGRLVYSWLRGVKGQLHSGAQNVVLIMMQSLGSDSLPTDIMLSLISETLCHLAVEICPGGLTVFWEAIKVSINHFCSSFNSGKLKSSDATVRALKVIHQLCSHSDAIHVTKPSDLVDLLLSIYGSFSPLPEAMLSELSSISAILLMSPNVRLPQDRTVKICSKVLTTSPPHIILTFVKHLLSWSALETLILPRLLEIVARDLVSDSTNGLGLQILAQLVQFKVPSLLNWNDELSLSSFNLDFVSASRSVGCTSGEISKKLLSILNISKQADISNVNSTLKERFYALRVLPHVIPLNSEETLKILKIHLIFLCGEIKKMSSILETTEKVENKIEPEVRMSRLLLLFVASVEAVIHIQGEKKGLESSLEIELFLETLLPPSRIGSCRLSALRALNLCLSSVDLHAVEDVSRVSLSVYESLKYNLSASHHSIREVACRILCQLPLAPELQNIFRICLDAESVGVTVTEYRDKLRFLEKLSFDASQPFLIKHPDYRLAPLHFILGSLYVNFKLLWEPLQSLVLSYAVGMSSADFWPTFHRQLTVAAEQRDFSHAQGTAPDAEFECSVLNEFYSALNSVEDRPDYAHYRLLLWQACHSFPEVCEKRNRDVATLFLTFVEEEYYSSNAEVARTWDIQKHDDGDIAIIDDHDNNSKAEDASESENEEENDDEPMDVDDGAVKKKHNLKKTSSPQAVAQSEEKPSAHLLTKTLLAYLQLFSKMQNPRTIFRESELNQVYNDLLPNKNPDVQKAALECILTYKHKSIVPYSDHLFALIDTKSFKNEISKFRIDKDSGIILEEHRAQLIPIIMRVVYSKMTAKTGMRTGGKAGAAMRRALVLRFLAGCHEDEMLIFVNMAFRFFDQYLQDDLAAMVDSIQSNIILEKVVPPRRLLSAVNLLSVVQERFGGLMGTRLLSLILQLLTCVGATVDGILKKRECIHVGYLGALRTLRTSCLEVLTQFFDRFEAYPWTTCEIDSVLRVFVLPTVDRLPIEGVHSPTALMKLFVVWSQHPRYFTLFGAHAPNAPESNPLSAIMKLLLGTKTHSSVCGAIMEILENLLTLKDHGKIDENDMEVDETYLEERAAPIFVTLTLSLKEDEIKSLNLPEEANLGSKLLFPHLSSVLERLRIKLAACTKHGSGLNKRELLVLSCLSEFVRTPETSATLAQLLLPILTRRLAVPREDEEIALKMMNTLNHLIRNVGDPYFYARPIAALFSSINGVTGRKMLASLVNTIAECSAGVDKSLKEEMEQMATVACDLNAFDKRWVEQPDFDRRLDAFKRVQTLLDDGKLSVELGVVVIHHCFYVLREEKDLSLRDCASHCLRRVAPLLSTQYSNDEATCKFLLDTTILTLIRKSISKNSGETLQSEAVLLLGEMARKCSNLHPVMRDLNLLTNIEDVEVDFFENLQHLQLHRKTRALLKICEVFRGVEKAPSSRTLTQFILPLASQFLCSETHVGKNSLVDAAVDVVGVVSRLLSWHQYEALLRYYLGRLKSSSVYQKQLVRIVMNILDAFHFDLSKARSTNTFENQSKGTPKPTVDEKKNDLNGKVLDEKNESDETDDKGEESMEDLVEQMDVEDEETESEINVDDTGTQKAPLAVERQEILCPSAALRVTATIKAGLLPQLHNALTARTLIESVHKVNKKQAKNTHLDRDAEEEEILRVPMAFAVVKLLQRLPEEILTKNLPGVFLKLCTFLKSRLDSVRRVTRETLQKVMVSLGPSFLSTLLKEMTALLTRGFQVHVLVYSIHSVLIALKEVFKAGDIDDSLPYIVEVCKYDLFGYAAEEKEVAKVASKHLEAQTNKSFNALHLIAQFVSEDHLTNLLVPFKDIIQKAHSHKIVSRASDCLRQIVLGLSENALVSPPSLLIFAVGVASDSIPALTLKQHKELTPKQKEIQARSRSDCYIIKEAPKQRSGITSSDAARVAARMNAHLFVEFGLRLIYSLFKHEKLKGSGEDLRPLVDPLVPLFKDCLSSQHVKLCTISLQCLCWILHFDLPSLRSNISSISALIFGLLHKFAAAGLGKGDNFDLVVAAFKAVSVLVRDVKYHTLDQDQLKALLLYAEQDISDANKHATAFSLLKAILSRKLIVPEMHDVMDRVATLSITSDLVHVRAQARVVFHQFLIDYPLGKKLEKHLSFYLSQLNYELQPGRESALEMVNSVISTFPLHVLTEHSGLFFLMLGARLVNDDAPDCRKMVAQCINKMLSRISQNERDRLFNIALVWFRDKLMSHRRLAAQLCGVFVVCEKESFQRRLPDLLPPIIAQFGTSTSEDTNEPGQFVKAPSALAPTNGGMKQEVSESERMGDHHMYQVLQLILKICSHCPSWLSVKEFDDHIYNLTEHVQSLLAHPHEWVRLSSAQILTHILSALNVESLAQAVNNESVSDDETENSNLGFFGVHTTQRLKSMILDHCAQLAPGVDVGQQLLLQVVKNLVIFADVLKDVNEEDTDQKNAPEVEEKRKPISLVWLAKRMRKVVNMEVVQAPKSTTMRTMVLNWTAAITVKLGGERIKLVLHHLLAPIVRELSSDEPAPEGSEIAQLRSLSKQVGSLMKKTVGHEYFIQMQSRLQSQISAVRAERRVKRKHEAVAEPEKAAKRKIQKQVRKKELKKVRQSKMRGKRFKGKREVSLEDE